MDNFWIIPIVAMVAGCVIGAGAIEYKVNTVWPNGLIELEELNEMSCIEIKEKNAIGNYWTPNNGQFARDKVDACIDAETAQKKQLKEIFEYGSHQDKIDAGFTKLWFGVYDHDFLRFTTIKGNVTAPMGVFTDYDLYPSDNLVIIGYNNTVKFTNGADTVIWFVVPELELSTKALIPGESDTLTFTDPGEYNLHSQPYLHGTIKVLEQ